MGRVPIETQAIWAETLGLEPGAFARTLLRYYEPELHRLLFEGAAVEESDPVMTERAAQA